MTPSDQTPQEGRKTKEQIAYGKVEAEPWGDITNPDAPRKWLPVVGGHRITNGTKPAFERTRAAAMAAGYALQARVLAAYEVSQ